MANPTQSQINSKDIVSNKLSAQQQLDQDISELRRKIRIMTSDLQAYQEESKMNLDRQSNIIQRLKDENKVLCKEMIKLN
jgi:SMC interacting uncharacterized protein involved in chromosome segregation